MLFKSQVKMGYTFSFYNLKYQANEMKIKNGISTSFYDLLSSKQLSKGICLYLGFKSKQTFQLLVFLVSPIFADKAENRLVSPVFYTILFFLLILLLLLLYAFLTDSHSYCKGEKLHFPVIRLIDEEYFILQQNLWLCFTDFLYCSNNNCLQSFEQIS